MNPEKIKRPKGDEARKAVELHSIDQYPLSSRIQYLRDTRELTQLQLAEKANVSQSTIAQIESGSKKPSIETLEAIAYALDVNLAVFFSGNDIHVFDMKRLRKRYKDSSDLNPTLYKALGEVIRYAKEIGFPM
jgi:transcriptional regulator with XRE-family HTH domain